MPRFRSRLSPTSRTARSRARRSPIAVPVLQFHMPSRREAVAPAVARVLRAARPAGLDAGQRADLAVAVAEALSNAAIHGNRLRPGSQVEVTVRVTPKARVVVAVRDSGPGFDVSALSDRTHPSRLMDPNGRGVFLMRRLVDRLVFNAAGNRVRLTLERRARRRSDR